MGEGRAMTGMDRLPWLTDDAPPPARRGGTVWIAAALALIVAVAAISYWLGVNSWGQPAVTVAPQPAAPESSQIVRPEAAPPQAPQREVEPAPAPEIAPAVAPPMPRIAEPPARRPARAVRRPIAAPPAKPAPVAKPVALTPWPVRVIDGASGRLVRVGAFSSVHQAKKGWWAIVRSNPALKRLPALVVPMPSLRNGATYYRLQMGTTSQAHSEVLCQRMRIVGQSCVVVALANRGGSAG